MCSTLHSQRIINDRVIFYKTRTVCAQPYILNGSLMIVWFFIKRELYVLNPNKLLTSLWVVAEVASFKAWIIIKRFTNSISGKTKTKKLNFRLINSTLSFVNCKILILLSFQKCINISIVILGIKTTYNHVIVYVQRTLQPLNNFCFNCIMKDFRNRCTTLKTTLAYVQSWGCSKSDNMSWCFILVSLMKTIT